jgi:hypothetical protein
MTTPKDFAAWYRALAEEQKSAFAKRSQTTRNYIESHLLAPYKIPREEMMRELADSTDGAFSVASLAAWFYESRLAKRDARASA